MDLDYLKKVGIYLLIITVSLGLLFYVGYHFYHAFTKEVETTPCVESSLEETAPISSYLFMTEQVLSSPKATGGSIVPMAKEGENVKKTGNVAEIYSVSSPATVAEINEIDEKISLLNSVADSTSVSVKGSSESESELFDVLSEIRKSGNNGDIFELSSLRSSFINILNKRSVLTRKDTIDFTAEISELQNRRSTLRSSLGNLLDTIETPVSGYFYSETDGYEEIFKASDLSDITYLELVDLLKSDPASNSNAVCKIVTDANWYLVSLLDTSYKNTFEEGDSCTLHMAETDLTLDIYRVITDPDGVALILNTDIFPEDYTFKRSVDADIVLNTYKGLSVPASAIRHVNGNTGVYVLNRAVIEFRRVEILYSGDTDYIVKENSNSELGEDETPWLALNDVIITEGKGLYDGRVLGD